jgi:hypothetical protein
MPGETKLPYKHNSKVSVSEILFGTLLGIAAVCSIWISSTLIIHLYQNL